MERGSKESEPKEKIQGIIFDADGVILNGERIDIHLERDFGISRLKSREFFMGNFQSCLLGQADVLDLLPEALSTWNIPMSPDQFLKYWISAEEGINTPLLQYVELLKNSGYECFLATNQEQHRFSYMLDELGFSTLFDRTYSSHSLGSKKPNAEFYERMLSDIPVKNRYELLFWDDTPANIEGALTVGIRAEHYTTFSDFEEKMKRYVNLNSMG